MCINSNKQTELQFYTILSSDIVVIYILKDIILCQVNGICCYYTCLNSIDFAGFADLFTC